MPRGRVHALVALMLRRMAPVASLFLAAFLLATSLVYYFEKDVPDPKFTSYGDAVWFGVVTLSTVGYGDLYPATPAGRAVTSGFILFTLLTVGFLLTAFSETVLEVKRMEELGLIGTRMSGHVVVLGFGGLARTAVEELLSAGRQVALLCTRADELPLARQVGERRSLYVTLGEATQELLRERLNATAAVSAVVALGEDSLNLIATLNLRALAPALPVVVAVNREELRQTLMANGVTYVATPHELSGRLVASAVFEPQVAQLIEDLSSGASGDCDLQQRPAGELAGATIGEIRGRFDAEDGPLLVAIARRNGERFEVLPHPGRELKVGPTDVLLVLTRRREAAPRSASA